MPETDQGSINLQWAYSLFDGLAAAGVRDAIISPGSRSTPLVLAADAHPEIRTRVIVDERSAAFYALGQGRINNRPTAVIATSGSAPAHWHPALLEASHGQVPLLLLSADRPPELHGWDANQTTDQRRLFGRHLRAFHDPGVAEDNPEAQSHIRSLGVRAAHQACWPEPGPVQINLPFREPLVPARPFTPPPPGRVVPVEAPELAPGPPQLARIREMISGKRGLIVCGPMREDAAFNDAVTALARQLDCPILADPLSGLRFGGHDSSRILAGYDAFLRQAPASKQLRPDWILAFGRPPVSRHLNQYLAGVETGLVLCDPFGRWPDPHHKTLEMVRADPRRLCTALSDAEPNAAPGDWLARWLALEQLTRGYPGGEEDCLFEGDVIASILAHLPDNGILFSGNSMPIRQLDCWSGTGARALQIVANRGLSGIDGNLSTLAGIADASGQCCFGLVGDLTLFHDLNGLAAARESDLTILLLNNNGGGIFDYLPQSQLECHQRYWKTPLDLDFGRAAALFGLEYRRVERRAELDPAIEWAASARGAKLIEVTIDPARSRSRHQAYWEAIGQKIETP
jgi:2-succinyl-5-enolpyruvyl-6-hydroxy-3-cyclohexene-1-carboxylate synthase